MSTPINNSLSNNVRIDAMLKQTKWADTNLTYNFPGAASYFPAQYLDGVTSPWSMATFEPASASLKATITKVLASEFAAVSNLSFTLKSATTAQNFVGGPTTGSDISIAMADLTSGGIGFGAGSGRRSGDIWFDGTPPASNPNRFNDIKLGDNDYRVAMHEIGHALGLRHPHAGETGDLAPTVNMPASLDAMEFSVMTYRMHVGDNDIAITTYPQKVETFGYAQSLMMLDIQALQYMYGADFTTNATATVYKFSPLTGEMFVNGVGQGTPGDNRVFRTIWDGGGTDTYDFSNYTGPMTISLAPGGWSMFSAGQRAMVNETTGLFAKGNLYNAFQFQSDARSLIENARGGGGADNMTGNVAKNSLFGNAGNDILNGLAGSDTLNAGTGDDLLNGGNGIDILVGGAGTDTFVFNAAIDLANADRITDFVHGVDKIRLENSGADRFNALATGALSAAAFKKNAAGVATDSSDRIVYKTTTGELFYDSDGNGVAAAEKFATIVNFASSTAVLTEADFVVV